ncbi:zinc ribbon domain-containing protein [Comamonadaceae bacterium M7527]|nr:zinc ribbon domain-containing protein [Comamonadaceae bacterium M7527]
MPIYAYKCAACGFAKDVLRKMSDPALTQCPSCQAESFEKQVTAAGFQLKGSGWYVTDFRDGAQKDGGSKEGSSKERASAGSGEQSSAAATSTSSASSATAPAASTPSPAAAAPSAAAGSTT